MMSKILFSKKFLTLLFLFFSVLAYCQVDSTGTSAKTNSKSYFSTTKNKQQKGNAFNSNRSTFSINADEFWYLTGNTLATGNEFLGTLNAYPLNFRVGNAQRLQITNTGRFEVNNTSGGNTNLFFGLNTGNESTTGNRNIGFGYKSLSNNQNGSGNSAFGTEALTTNTSGYDNTAIGINTLKSNTTGFYNTAIGSNSLRSNTTGIENTAIGFYSLNSNNLGNYNIAVGPNAGLLSTGSYNVFLGKQAGNTLTSGDNNVFLGANTNPNISTTSSNQLNIADKIYGSGINSSVAVGIGVTNPQARLHTNGSLRFEGLSTSTGPNSILGTDSNGNVFRYDPSLIGGADWSLNGNTLATGNEFLGTINPYPLNFRVSNVQRLQITTTGRFQVSNTSGGNSNLYFGFDAGNETTTSISGNTAFGNSSLTAVTTGFHNAAFGYKVLSINTTGHSNTAVGAQALSNNTTGAINTAIGQNSLLNNSTGQANTASGVNALYTNTTGNNNTASGFNSLANNSVGNNNTAYGYISLPSSTGNNNTAIGSSALGIISTGDNNIGIGNRSGYYLASGTNNIFIGNDVQPVTNNVDNYLNIGNKIYGTLNGADMRIGFGIPTPQANFHTRGTVRLENMPYSATLPTNILGTDGNGNVYNFNPNLITSSATDFWSLNGNSLATGNEFIGTTTNHDLIFKRNNVLAGKIQGNNTSFGLNSLLNNTTGLSNTAFGTDALSYNTVGNGNAAYGTNSSRMNVSGHSNSSFGINSLFSNTTGAENTSLGMNSMHANTTGSSNVALGTASLTLLQTGNQNTALGRGAGSALVSGDNNVFIGAGANANISNTSSDQLNIANKIYGSGTGGNEKVGIGVQIPTAQLHTKNSVRFENLPMQEAPNALLGTDVDGNVYNYDPSLLAGDNVNIYNSNGALTDNRYLDFNDKTLGFYGNIFSQVYDPNMESDICPTGSSGESFSTINGTGEYGEAFLKPNYNNGYFKLRGTNYGRNGSNGAQLNFGIGSDNSWMQSSTHYRSGRDNYCGNSDSKLYLNPLGGKVAIGTTNINVDADCSDCNDYRLFVAQGIRTEKVRVDIASIKGWADYVFEKNYTLMPLKDLENYITTNGHLPNIPKAEEVVKEGIDLGAMNSKLLEKIEELTLHTIELNKKNESQQKTIENLVLRLEQLEKSLKQ